MEQVQTKKRKECHIKKVLTEAAATLAEINSSKEAREDKAGEPQRKGQ